MAKKKITIINLQKRLAVKGGAAPAGKAGNRRLSYALVKRIAGVILSRREFEVTVCLLTDSRIRRLNKRFLGHDYPTDVLAFESACRNKGVLSADIAVSVDRAFAQSRAFATAPLYETYLYIAHGLLHIAGYRDKNIRERAVMDRKAQSALKKAGITKEYAYK